MDKKEKMAGWLTIIMVIGIVGGIFYVWIPLIFGFGVLALVAHSLCPRRWKI